MSSTNNPNCDRPHRNLQAYGQSPDHFRPKDGNDDQRPGGGGRNAQADWKGRPRSNITHASTTDPDGRLYRKSHHTASLLWSFAMRGSAGY